MKSPHGLFVIPTALLFSVSLARGQELPDPSVLAGKIANWPAPAYWSLLGREIGSLGERSGVEIEAVEGVVSSVSPMPFIAITPCRLVDTRPASGFPGAYGPPALVANATRDFDLNSAPHCPQVAAGAQAYSLNVTVTETQGPGDVRVWPTGSFALVSTQNWGAAGITLANAAVVPAGTNGSITVQAAGSGTHLILDINWVLRPGWSGRRQYLSGPGRGQLHDDR